MTKELQITFTDCRGVRHVIHVKVPSFAPVELVRDQFTGILSKLGCELSLVAPPAPAASAVRTAKG
jgi:hypothetical protein